MVSAGRPGGGRPSAGARPYQLHRPRVSPPPEAADAKTLAAEHLLELADDIDAHDLDVAPDDRVAAR